MKKLLFIISLFFSFAAIAQTDEYYRTVDWKFYPDSIVQLTDSTYRLKALPFDYNDPGAINRTIGNYVVDFVGHRFKVIDSTATKITVWDIYNTGQAPQTEQIARCYRSVGGGDAEFIGSVDYSPLDESARWKINGADNELLWLNFDKYIPLIQNDITHEPSGFEHPEDVIVNYNSTNRTITLTGNTTAFWKGDTIRTLVSGWTSTAHTATAGVWYLYYNGSSFVWSQTPWTFDMVQIAFVNYPSFAIRETHGLMPYQTHKTLHETVGTYLTGGGDLSGYTLNTTTASERRPLISTTTLRDEDNTSAEAALLSESYTRFNLSGTNTANFTASSADIVALSGNQPYWNEWNGSAWVQTLMSNNSYSAVWLVALPVTADVGSQAYRYLWVQPQANSSTLSTIQGLSSSSVSLGTLQTATPELVFIGKIIIRYTGGNWQLVSVEKLLGNKVNQQAIVGGSYLSVVTTDNTLTGNGTTSDPLKVDTTVIATQYDLLTGLGSNYVTTNTTQSISGAKTFTSNPEITGTNAQLTIDGTNSGILRFELNNVFNGGLFAQSTQKLDFYAGGTSYVDMFSDFKLEAKSAGENLVAGMMYFDSDDNTFRGYNGTSWIDLGAAGGGTTTNALTMNNSGTGDASGTTFNGSVARTISFNTIGAAGLAASNTFTDDQTIQGSAPYLFLRSTSVGGTSTLRFKDESDLPQFSIQYDSNNDRTLISSNNHYISTQIGALEVMNLATTGQLKLPQYTGTTFDGTITKYLGVDASGNVVKGTISAGVTDHSALSNLSYATAGHTDFVSTNTTQNITGLKTFVNTTGFIGSQITGASSSGGLIIYDDVPTNVLEFGFNNLANEGYIWSNVSNPFKIGVNSAERLRILTTGQLKLNNYTSSSSFTGTGVAALQVDASGNVITTAISGGSGTDLSFSGASSPVTLNSSTGADVTFTAGVGISLSATSGNVTITNSQPNTNQTLSFSTPNLTISAGNTVDLSSLAVAGGWTDGGSYITNTTATDEVRIGSTSDAGSYIFQVTGQSYFSTHLYGFGQGIFAGDVYTLGSLGVGEIATPTGSNNKIYSKTDNELYYLDNDIEAKLSAKDNDFTRFPMLQTDFLGPAGAGTAEAAWGFDYAVIASGTQAKIASEANHPGILRTSSSTSENSGGYCMTGNEAVYISGGEVFECIFQPRVASNTNTTIRIGFMDSYTSTAPVDGCYFELAANTLNIVGINRYGTTNTTSTATVATLAVNTWYRLKIEVNSAASSVTYTVYNSSGTVLGTQTNTGTIPTGSTGRETGCGVIATNSGTSATLLAYWDMMSFYYNKPLTR